VHAVGASRAIAAAGQTAAGQTAAGEAAVVQYVFDSTDHMRRSVDGAAGRAILEAFEKRGLVGLAIYDSGARCFCNHLRAVSEPGDLQGLKIRVPPSDMFVSLVRALGANPTPLSYGEIFSALQTKLIDGAENNWTTFQTSRHFGSAVRAIYANALG
jgi:TRAP-type C4-dicarboxylate transport system substrate-binding protein